MGDAAEDRSPLIGYAESSRTSGWSLRSALVRLAQPEPVRAGAVLGLIRRVDASLKPHRGELDTPTAPEVRAQLGEGAWRDDLVPVLWAALALDELAEHLADWADRRDGPPPVHAVDDATGRASRLLEDAGVPGESTRPGRGGGVRRGSQ